MDENRVWPEWRMAEETPEELFPRRRIWIGNQLRHCQRVEASDVRIEAESKGLRRG